MAVHSIVGNSDFSVYFCLNDSAMITVKPIVVLSNRRKDGSFLVYIRVYYRGQVRRIPTAIVCRPGDLTRSGKIKSQDIQSKADTIATRMLESISSYTTAELDGMDIDQVVRKIRTADNIQLFRLYENVHRYVCHQHFQLYNKYYPLIVSIKERQSNLV